MRAGAIGAAFQQRGALAAPRALDRFRRGLVHGQHVVAVNLETRYAVHGPPSGHTRAGRGVGERDLGGELVVLAHEDDRQLPDAGHVQTFVEGTVVHCAVAEEGDRNLIRLRELETIASPRGLEDARGNDAAGAHQADLRREQVHRSAPSM